MARTVFALELLKTSQGWVEPTCPLAALDMPEDELEDLHEAGKVVSAEHDSPMARRAHEIRRAGDKAGAPGQMLEASRMLSPESPPDALAPADESHEPTSDDQSPGTSAGVPLASGEGTEPPEADPSKSPTDGQTQHPEGQEGAASEPH